MKWKAFFLMVIVLCLFSAEKALSQRKLLNLNFSNVNIEEVLNEIEKQSDFYFLYNQDLIDTKQQVQINISSGSIEEILNTLLAGSNIQYIIFDRQIVLTNKSSIIDPFKATSANRKTVAGLVRDANGQPIPGATVMVKGSVVGQTTNSNC